MCKTNSCQHGPKQSAEQRRRETDRKCLGSSWTIFFDMPSGEKQFAAACIYVCTIQALARRLSKHSCQIRRSKAALNSTKLHTNQHWFGQEAETCQGIWPISSVFGRASTASDLAKSCWTMLAPAWVEHHLPLISQCDLSPSEQDIDPICTFYHITKT